MCIVDGGGNDDDVDEVRQVSLVFALFWTVYSSVLINRRKY